MKRLSRIHKQDEVKVLIKINKNLDEEIELVIRDCESYQQVIAKAFNEYEFDFIKVFHKDDVFCFERSFYVTSICFIKEFQPIYFQRICE